MLLHSFTPATRANGPGLRALVHFQGCSLGCEGCFNPKTHPFTGEDVTPGSVAQRISAVPDLDGATFSGGEPMQQATALLELITLIRSDRPELSLGMFTGYTESELERGDYCIHQPPVLALLPSYRRCLWRVIKARLDFAVFGRYNKLQPCDEPLRTSKNQRLVLFSDRYTEKDFGRQLVEITIDASKSTVTGFPVLGFPV